MLSKIAWIVLPLLVWSCSDEAESNDGSGGSSGTGSGDTTEPACVGIEPLVLNLKRDGQPYYDTGPLEFAATLTTRTENSAVFETCEGRGGAGGAGGEGGASGCDGNALTLEIEAPGLALPIDVGTTVAVSWNLTGGGGVGIRSMVVLHDLGDETIGGFLLAVGNGLPLSNAPVSYDSSELDCHFVPSTQLCGDRKAYALTFTATENSSSSVRLTMGQTGQLELDPNSDADWRARNLQAIASGNCDAIDPFRYYVVRAR